MSLETQDIGQIIETVMYITSISKYGNATVVWREYLVNLGYKGQKIPYNLKCSVYTHTHSPLMSCQDLILNVSKMDFIFPPK